MPAVAIAAAPELSDREFEDVRTLLKDVAGIALQPGKQGLVRSRLASRLRTLELPSVAAYLRYVADDRTGKELVHVGSPGTELEFAL